MKIGYPCINNRINCTANRTFRLVNYSEDNLIKKVKENLDCLKKTLNFNVENNLLFFRIGSGLIPFASHEICKFNWFKYFQKEFKEIGDFIKKNEIRISMHPDQFVVLNSKNDDIVKKSVKEIDYHCDVLDFMGLNQEAKIQIHIGGVYDDKNESINRFIKNYNRLKLKIKKRLVIENDHISYSLKDCLSVNKRIKIPIVFDVFHHECLNNKEDIFKAIKMASETWSKKDGKLMVDYSNQEEQKRKGVHRETINLDYFKSFLSEIKNIDCDIMLEIKDKEKSAIKVINLLKNKK
jgi:UV DNA damage endonuclease